MRNLSASLLCLVLLAGVASAQEVKSYDTPYYPLKVGNRWTYRTDKGHHVVVQVQSGKVLTRSLGVFDGREKKEHVAGYVLRISSGDKSEAEVVAVLEDGVYRFEAAGKKLAPPLRLLKLPLNRGDTWKVESKSADAILRGMFLAGEESVKTASGTYPAMTVSARDFQLLHKSASEPVDWQAWYARGAGLVRQRFRVGRHESVLDLEKFEPAR